jgi:hypothetical protein
LQKGVSLQLRNSSFFQAEMGEVKRREKKRRRRGGDMVAGECV